MSQITTCPHCSTRLRVSDQITDKTMICPRCLADVDNSQQGFQVRAADIDTDVKRGLSDTSIVLLVLIGLCVLGIALVFFGLSSVKGQSVKPQASALPFVALIGLFGLLDVLISIAMVRGLIRWGISGVRTPTVGRVLGIVFLALGTVVAAIVFFFFTCFGLLVLSSS
jgi:hypothetical protein